MQGKAVAKGKNKRGVVFALVAYKDGPWSVIKLCENYCGHAPDGLAKTWRVVKSGLPEDTARDLYRRRLNGTQR